MIAGARNYKDSRKWPGYQGETFYARTDHTPRQLGTAGYIYISTYLLSIVSYQLQSGASSAWSRQ